MKINRHIFREYDIRGLAGQDLNPENVTAIGKAFGTFLHKRGKRSLVLGRDVRLTSPQYRDAVCKGILSAGISVIDIGIVPTPLLYYALHLLEPDCGMIVTASHNPKEYNGFKLCVNRTTIHGEDIQEVLSLVETEEFEVADKKGTYSEVDIIPRYLAMVKERVQITRPLKVVVDCGNGTGGLVAPQLLRRLGCEVIELFTEPDGNFPNHPPDPTVEENIPELKRKVVETGADIGIGFDGDSDRISAVDEKGAMIYGDYLLVLFARDMLSRCPGAKVVFEVKCSQNLEKEILKKEGVPVMGAAGHSLIKQRMVQEGALLGGEISGHIFFKENFFGHDDALYAAAKLIEILGKENRKVSEHFQDLPKTCHSPEARLFCPDHLKFSIVKDLTEVFEKEYEVSTVDGVRINFGFGWGLIRSSNTQPAITVRIEAENREGFHTIRETLVQAMRKYPEITGYDALIESSH